MATVSDAPSHRSDAHRAADPRADGASAERGAVCRRLRWQAVPAWLISTLLHVMILLSLGLVTLAEPVEVVHVLSASVEDESAPEIERFTIEPVDPGQSAEPERVAQPVTEIREALETFETAPVKLPSERIAAPVEIRDLAAQLAPSDAVLQSLDSLQPAALSGRSGEVKAQLLRDYGGTASSEAAVAEALKWLARHQMPNGAWTFHHPLVCGGNCGDPGDRDRAQAFNAATSLALLPFMGAGQTHYTGQYKETVRAGLLFLIRNGNASKHRGRPILDLSELGGDLYSHGLAAIALCEAYAMTEDPALAGPAQAALNFIIYAQCRDGGWRYLPKQPGGGDTSVTGWQIMALKSGHMAHLDVPPATIERATRFLDKVQLDGGAQYGYTSPREASPSCTAIGLLCRMYTGWDKSQPGIQAGVKVLADVGVNKRDIYYNYYAAQVLRHTGGRRWETFNRELRDWLVETQAQRGGAHGSWHFPNSETNRGPKEGGRLASTAFATMILEVYYRHMPLYGDGAADEAFPL